MKVLFKENQQFNLLALGLSLPILVLLSISFYRQYDSEASFITNMLNHQWLILGLLFVGFLVAVSIFSKLETTITDKDISIRFFPALWNKRVILWSDVEDVFVREYNPLQEFGGWSIFRLNMPIARGLGRNRAINLRGNKGLQLVMKDGSRLLIGTQCPEALESSLVEIKTV